MSLIRDRSSSKELITSLDFLNMISLFRAIRRDGSFGISLTVHSVICSSCKDFLTALSAERCSHHWLLNMHHSRFQVPFRSLFWPHQYRLGQQQLFLSFLISLNQYSLKGSTFFSKTWSRSYHHHKLNLKMNNILRHTQDSRLHLIATRVDNHFSFSHFCWSKLK